MSVKDVSVKMTWWKYMSAANVLACGAAAALDGSSGPAEVMYRATMIFTAACWSWIFAIDMFRGRWMTVNRTRRARGLRLYRHWCAVESPVEVK